MISFPIMFLICIPIGYVYESYYYELQKIGKFSTHAKVFIFLWNVCAFGLVWTLQEMVSTVGIENFSDFESIGFTIGNLLAISIFGSDGFALGSYVKAQQRYVKNIPVPEHLIKSDEDKEREQKIREAHKERRYKEEEQRAGMYEAEVEPEPEPEPEIDHEAELEKILKSRK